MVAVPEASALSTPLLLPMVAMVVASLAQLPPAGLLLRVVL